MKFGNERITDAVLTASLSSLLVGMLMKYQFSTPESIEELVTTPPLNSAFNFALTTLFPESFQDWWNSTLVDYSGLSTALILASCLVLLAWMSIQIRSEPSKERLETMAFLGCCITAFASLFTYGALWSWIDVSSKLMGWVAFLSLIPWVFGSVLFVAFCFTKFGWFEQSKFDNFIRALKSTFNSNENKSE